MKIMATSFKASCTASSTPPTLASAGDSWSLTGKSRSVSCGGHCSFLLGPGAHKALLVPSESLFP